MVCMYIYFFVDGETPDSSPGRRGTHLRNGNREWPCVCHGSRSIFSRREGGGHWLFAVETKTVFRNDVLRPTLDSACANKCQWLLFHVDGEYVLSGTYWCSQGVKLCMHILFHYYRHWNFRNRLNVFSSPGKKETHILACSERSNFHECVRRSWTWSLKWTINFTSYCKFLDSLYFIFVIRSVEDCEFLVPTYTVLFLCSIGCIT